MNILLCVAISATVSAAVCGLGAFLMLCSLKHRFAQRDLCYTKKFSEEEKKVATKFVEVKTEIEALREQRSQESAAVDFNAGIAAILGYDPMEVRKRMRENQRSEDI